MTPEQIFEEEIHIEEILLEAHAFGLDHEVDTYAKKLLKKKPSMSRLAAYEEAFNEWIK